MKQNFKSFINLLTISSVVFTTGLFAVSEHTQKSYDNKYTTSTNTNRAFRIITDSTYTTNTKADLTPIAGQTLDGSSDAYRINKAYEGIKVFSNGVEWFIIQKKAS